MIFVGDDWAEDHHDIYVCDAVGVQLARRRLDEGVDGIAGFHALVAEYVDEPGDVIVGIEIDRGLWVTALVAAGYQVELARAVSPVQSRNAATSRRAEVFLTLRDGSPGVSDRIGGRLAGCGW